MRGPVRVLVVTAVVVAAGALAARVGLDRLVRARRDDAVMRVERALGRRVRVGTVSASVRRGAAVVVRDVEIGEAPGFGAGAFVRARSVTIRLRLRALLRRRVEVSRLVVDRPVVHLVRREDGAWNVRAGGVVRSAAPPPPSPAGGFALALALADVRDGEVVLDDRRSGTRVRAHDVDLSVRDVRAGAAATARLDATFDSPGARVRASVRVGPLGALVADSVLARARLDGEVVLDAEAADALAWADSLARARRGPNGPRRAVPPQLAGPLRLRIALSGTPRAPVVDATLDLERVEAGRAGAWRRRAGAPLAVHARGAATSAGFVAGAALSRVRLDVDALASPLVLESVRLDSLRIDARGVAVDSIVARGALGRTPWRLALAPTRRITPGAPGPWVWCLRADSLRRADVQRDGSRAPRTDVLRDVVVRGTWTAAPAGGTVTGRLRAAHARAAGVPVADVRADFEARGGVFNVRAWRARTLGGTLRGRARVDARDAARPCFDVRVDASDVDAARLVRARGGVAVPLEGRGDAVVHVRGDGRTWTQVAPTLDGDAVVSLRDGRILGLDVLGEILDALETVPGVTPAAVRALRRRWASRRADGATPFDRLGGALTLSRGRVRFDALRLDGPDVALRLAGSVDLAGRLDVALDVILPPSRVADVVAAAPAAAALRDADGKLPIALRVRGTLRAPSVELDAEALGRRLRRGLVGGGLHDLLEGLRSGARADSTRR